MTQEDFGAIGNVRRAAQYLHEAGERKPSTEYLARITAAGADLGYLLSGARSPETGGTLRIDEDVLSAVLRTADDLCRNHRGRPLDPELRIAVTLALCRAVPDKQPSEVDWEGLLLPSPSDAPAPPVG